jgi:hypothetical protein
MKTNLLIIVLTLFAIPVFSQGQKSAVEKVVQTYFDGYSAGDTTMMKEAFHPDFHLSWIDPWRKGDEAFKQVDRKGLFAFFGPSWSNLEISASLDEVVVSENAATAKATVTLKNIVIWTDYLSLLKINDRWWIVSKISEGKIVPKD